MNLLNIFHKQKNLSDRKIEAHFPSLGEMWICFFAFHPWNPSDYKVKFKKTKIISATATADGIEVESNETIAKMGIYASDTHISGIINKFNQYSFGWIGFFETQIGAIHAYNELMDKWIDVIKSNKVVGN